MQRTISLKIETPEEFADYLATKNISNNLISAAAESRAGCMSISQMSRIARYNPPALCWW
jgi:hypothetical protein